MLITLRHRDIILEQYVNSVIKAQSYSGISHRLGGGHYRLPDKCKRLVVLQLAMIAWTQTVSDAVDEVS